MNRITKIFFLCGIFLSALSVHALKPNVFGATIGDFELVRKADTKSGSSVRIKPNARVDFYSKTSSYKQPKPIPTGHSAARLYGSVNKLRYASKIIPIDYYFETAITDQIHDYYEKLPKSNQSWISFSLPQTESGKSPIQSEFEVSENDKIFFFSQQQINIYNYFHGLFIPSPFGSKGPTASGAIDDNVLIDPISQAGNLGKSVTAFLPKVWRMSGGSKGVSRITAGSLKEFKFLVHQLSKPGSTLTQQELKQLEALTARFGGKLRYDLKPVKGKIKAPHVQIEGLGQRIEGRKIWLGPGVP